MDGERKGKERKGEVGPLKCTFVSAAFVPMQLLTEDHDLQD